MIQPDESTSRRKHLLRRLRKAAAQAVEQGDPWAKHEIHKIPAERVIRYVYDMLFLPVINHFFLIKSHRAKSHL